MNSKGRRLSDFRACTQRFFDIDNTILKLYNINSTTEERTMRIVLLLLVMFSAASARADAAEDARRIVELMNSSNEDVLALDCGRRSGCTGTFQVAKPESTRLVYEFAVTVRDGQLVVAVEATIRGSDGTLAYGRCGTDIFYDTNADGTMDRYLSGCAFSRGVSDPERYTRSLALLRQALEERLPKE